MTWVGIFIVVANWLTTKFWEDSYDLMERKHLPLDTSERQEWNCEAICFKLWCNIRLTFVYFFCSRSYAKLCYPIKGRFILKFCQLFSVMWHEFQQVILLMPCLFWFCFARGRTKDKCGEFVMSCLIRVYFDANSLLIRWVLALSYVCYYLLLPGQ